MYTFLYYVLILSLIWILCFVGILGWRRFDPAVIGREGSFLLKSVKIGGIKLKVGFCFWVTCMDAVHIDFA